MQADSGTDVLDTAGVAKLLRCSERHVRALLDRGAFPAPARLGALPRWSRAAVVAWIAAANSRVPSVRSSSGGGDDDQAR